MDNAVKYLRVGVPGKIEVGATESDGVITYEVRDTGAASMSGTRERIFDLFRRSGVQDRPGDGMGLAHARTLVRRLGGSINVESEPDCGAVFKSDLAPAMDATRRRGDGVTQPITIAMIEDDEGHARLIERNSPARRRP